MVKTQKKITQGKYAVLFLLILTTYSVCVINRFSLPEVDKYITYTYHCVDYSMGFCSRFLLGAVYSLFVENPSPESATVFENVLLLLLYAGISFLLARWYVRLPKDQNSAGFRLVLFCLTGSCAFPAFAKMPGMLEVPWLFFGILFIICLPHCNLRYAVPLFMFGFLLTHIGAMLTCVPLFAILLLYEYTLADTKTEKRIRLILFFISCAVAVISFCYFVMFEKQTLTYDIYEFNEIMEQRGSSGLYYYDFALYNNTNDLQLIESITFGTANPETLDPGRFVSDAESSVSLVHEILFQVELRLRYYLAENATMLKVLLGKLLVMLTVLSPLLVMFYKFFIFRFKTAKGDNVRRFLWFCCIALFPFTVILSMFISEDSVRWLTYGMLSLFTILFYISYREGSDAIRPVFTFINSFSEPVLTAYQILYALSVFSPYSL